MKRLVLPVFVTLALILGTLSVMAGTVNKGKATKPNSKVKPVASRAVLVGTWNPPATSTARRTTATTALVPLQDQPQCCRRGVTWYFYCGGQPGCNCVQINDHQQGSA